MLIFCRRIIINKPDILKKEGPLLLACNHPNSFLDAAILADLFKEPVYSLTRGDVFKRPFYRKILQALKTSVSIMKPLMNAKASLEKMVLS